MIFEGRSGGGGDIKKPAAPGEADGLEFLLGIWILKLLGLRSLGVVGGVYHSSEPRYEQLALIDQFLR